MEFGARCDRIARGVSARALVAALTACIALAAVHALAPPADAGIRAFKFGVVTGGAVPQPDVDLMARLGVKVARVSFNWNHVEVVRRRAGSPCSDAVYGRWRRYDDMVLFASRHDIKVLPVLLGSPWYVASRGSIPPHSSNERAYQDYRCFVRELVGRYGYGGHFEELEPDADPIRWWQVWNEPNLPNYAAERRVDATEYARLVTASSRAIRAVNPKAKVVLAGMPEHAEGAGASSEAFLRDLHAVPGIESQYDVLAIHPYAAKWDGVKGVMERTHDVLVELGAGDRPLWITESGYATGGEADHHLVKTEEGQANQLDKTFSMLQRNRERYNLGRVLWYNWRDVGTEEGSAPKWVQHAGLHFKDGAPKLACDRFREFTGSVLKCLPIPDPPAEK